MVNNDQAPQVVRFVTKGNTMWDWIFGDGWGSAGVKG
jgi:hypothetical protein